MLQISSGAWPSGLGVSAESCNEVHVEFECVQYPSSKCNESSYRTQVAHSIFRKFDSNLRIEVAASRCFFFLSAPDTSLNSLILALSLLDLYGTRCMLDFPNSRTEKELVMGDSWPTMWLPVGCCRIEVYPPWHLKMMVSHRNLLFPGSIFKGFGAPNSYQWDV